MRRALTRAHPRRRDEYAGGREERDPGADRDDGRRGDGHPRRHRLHRGHDHRRRAAGGADPAGRVRGRAPAAHRRHRLPGSDRAPQPPELQLPPALAGAAAVREPGPVVGRARLPAPDQRADAGDREDALPRARARALRRGQVPRRRRDDEPGHRALRATPASARSTRASCATASRRTTRRSRPPPAASPTSRRRTSTAFAKELARDNRLLLHLAEGTDDPARTPLPGAAAARQDVGDLGPSDRDPQRRPAPRGHPGLRPRRRVRWCGRRSRTCCCTAARRTSTS